MSSMFGCNAQRTTFIGQKPDGSFFKVGMATLLGRLGEKATAPEYQSTPGILAVARVLVDAGEAKGIVIVLDGMPILTAGDTEGIPSSAYN